jgi:hypothetical protein
MLCPDKSIYTIYLMVLSGHYHAKGDPCHDKSIKGIKLLMDLLGHYQLCHDKPIENIPLLLVR